MASKYFIFDPKVGNTIDPIIESIKSSTTKKEVIIQDPQRSSAQNRLFHDNISILAENSGYDMETMKNIIKAIITDDQVLMMYDFVEIKNGRIVQVFKSTADLNKKDFSILMDYVYLTGEKLGLKMIKPKDNEKFDPEPAFEVQNLEEPPAPKPEDIAEIAKVLFE